MDEERTPDRDLMREEVAGARAGAGARVGAGAGAGDLVTCTWRGRSLRMTTGIPVRRSCFSGLDHR